MIDVEEYCLKAFEKLKSKFDLPNKGLLAGGALANTINKLVYPDSLCVINDIDVFVLEKQFSPLDIKQLSSGERIYKTTQEITSVTKYYENYGRLTSQKSIDKWIKINSSERNGLINLVRYDINKFDPMFLLKTFDINCCQVAIDLETNKIYYTSDFKEYLETKNLKVTRPNSPSHTCLRLLKKRDELNASLDVKTEFKFLQLANDNYIKGDVRYFFADEKYLNLYEKYIYEISPYFELMTKTNSNYTSYRLIPNGINNIRYKDNQHIRGFMFNTFKENIYIEDFTFFYRNVFNNEKKLSIFNKFQQFYKTNEYVSGYKGEDLTYLERLCEYECTKLSFSDMTLVEQIKLSNKLKVIFDGEKKAEAVLEYFPLKFKDISESELEFELRIYQIKFRGEIQRFLEPQPVDNLF